ncbi:uncharacterized protein M6B38_392880 [Iris pallida]|uniref:Uncharacterized protein n=1 Tax=Iris pallida TaxID=29817 RepID=A0AAX6FZ29_IRIPA|nr:uncharacterized protein M6B38_392880 [Iris pallida]
MTHSPGEEHGETERSATSGGQAPVTFPADGTSVGILGGTPPATSMTVPGVAGALPVVPGAVGGALPPPAQRIPPPVADVLPPPPPLPTDMGQMLTFFQQMPETQRAQAEAQQRQTDAIRQGMEDAHQLALTAVEQRAPHPGRVLGTEISRTSRSSGPVTLAGPRVWSMQMIGSRISSGR